ncbi:kyphoscoliosis peptidase-like [Megalops cyprinoides]|uniref:kyphoscoliosis peptidase-like n=1 Tax=Megalops cyprinoides TaxID=118141 RepID=UPI001864A0ED|nr:kyphoscoliosis peptidase-like [Megalops cyprinoides]
MESVNNRITHTNQANTTRAFHSIRRLEKMGNDLQKMTARPKPDRSLLFLQNHYLPQAVGRHFHQNHNNNNNNTTEVTEGQRDTTSTTKKPLKPLQKGCLDRGSHKGPSDTKLTLAMLQQDWKLEILPDKRSTIPLPSSDGVQSKKMLFEKSGAVEHEAQRVKRQLSAESATRSFGVVKRSTVRKEEDGEMTPAVAASKPRLKALSLQRASLSTCSTPKRKPRKDLFSSTEVFQTVDACAIESGRQLREQKVFSVQAIAQAITHEATSELERLRAIWVWLCNNIEYDVSGYLGQSEKLCTPEQVVEAGRGVCCGYSSLCLQMCREMGIECQEVSGHSKGIGYRQGQSYQNTKSNHMWNTVKLEGQWYLLDACWGAGRVDINNQTFIKRYDDFYFLADPEDFIDSHYPDEQQWQLLESPVTLEDFEKRVFKTSEFYRLGLTLQLPKNFLIVTENGEATVSLGCRWPADFTYQISPQSSELTNGQSLGDVKDVGSSSGLLTVTRLGMRLRLMPPARGKYDIMVFARPANTLGTFSWVCSFLLECPEPKPSEEIPENPYLSWGLQPTAASLGLKQSTHSAEPVMTQTGKVQLVLQTSRPLMVLCELTHKDLDSILSKHCLATQIEPDKLTCQVLCPFRGYYRLSVFVRDYDQTSDGFQNAGNFLLHCTAGAINLNELFPSSLSSSCGPGIRTARAGLSKFSHTGTLISTQQGKCNITFHNTQDVELHAVLAKELRRPLGYPLTRHILFTHTDSKVTISVTLPEPGLYRLGLYAKTGPGQDFSPLCDFILHSSAEAPWPPFPCTFVAWRKGCVLFEPRSGWLPPCSTVCFRVRIPGVQSVSVVGEGRTSLQLNKSRVWEGEVLTGREGSQLKLAAGKGGESTEMAVIMSFDVLSDGEQQQTQTDIKCALREAENE